MSSRTQEAMDTNICKTLGTVRHNRLMGRISRYKMCLGDTKGANVTGMLKNSLRADFGAMHRQLICRISYRTVCKINTVNAVCRWGNRSSEMTRFAKRESNGTGNNAFQINFISMVYCDCFGISLL